MCPGPDTRSTPSPSILTDISSSSGSFALTDISEDFMHSMLSLSTMEESSGSLSSSRESIYEVVGAAGYSPEEPSLPRSMSEGALSPPKKKVVLNEKRTE